MTGAMKFPGNSGRYRRSDVPAGESPGNAVLADATDYLHAWFRAPGRPDPTPPPTGQPPRRRPVIDSLPPPSRGQAAGALLHGDCLEVMRRLPAGSIKAVVTSPPYNLRNSSGSGMRDGRGGKWEQAALLHGYATHQDAMPHAA